MPGNSIRRAAAALCFLLCLAAWPAARAQDKTSDTYPEQGKVLAHAASQKPSAHGTPVFRVETDLKIYEFEAKDPASLAVGDTITFRETRQTDGTYKITTIQVVLPTASGTVTAVASGSVTISQPGTYGILIDQYTSK